MTGCWLRHARERHAMCCQQPLPATASDCEHSQESTLAKSGRSCAVHAVAAWLLCALSGKLVSRQPSYRNITAIHGFVQPHTACAAVSACCCCHHMLQDTPCCGMGCTAVLPCRLQCSRLHCTALHSWCVCVPTCLSTSSALSMPFAFSGVAADMLSFSL